MHGIWEIYLGQDYLQLPCCIWYLDINNFWKNIAFEHLCERLYDELVWASPYSI